MRLLFLLVLVSTSKIISKALVVRHEASPRCSLGHAGCHQTTPDNAEDFPPASDVSGLAASIDDSQLTPITTKSMSNGKNERGTQIDHTAHQAQDTDSIRELLIAPRDNKKLQTRSLPPRTLLADPGSAVDGWIEPYRRPRWEPHCKDTEHELCCVGRQAPKFVSNCKECMYALFSLLNSRKLSILKFATGVTNFSYAPKSTS